MFFVLKTFSGVLGTFTEGTERSFTAPTALLLKDSGLITEVGSEKHQAWLAAQSPSSQEAVIETKPEPTPPLETKPAPAPKGKARK